MTLFARKWDWHHQQTVAALAQIGYTLVSRTLVPIMDEVEVYCYKVSKQ